MGANLSSSRGRVTRLRWRVLAAGLAFVSPACTFLVSFDDPPSDPRDRDAHADPIDANRAEASSDVVEEPVIESDADHCPRFVADPSAAPCSVNGGRAETAFCGCDRLANYQGKPSDLVVCGSNGEIVTIEPCSNGCASMPAHRSSLCDMCNGKADGTYCATELGADAGTVIMACSAGRQSRPAIECPRGTRCLGAGPSAECGS